MRPPPGHSIACGWNGELCCADNGGSSFLWQGYSGRMDSPSLFPASQTVFSVLRVVDSTGSTNSDVLAELDDARRWPHLSALVCFDQRSGRGRRGRSWLADPGALMAVSIVLRRPGVPAEHSLALPLVVGLAVRRALLPVVGVSLKWPNDVHVNGRKLAGILCESRGNGAIVAGVGINLRRSGQAFDAGQLDASRVASLDEFQPRVDPDAVLARLGGELDALAAQLWDAGGDLVASGLSHEYLSASSTVDTRVRVTRPGGEVIEGGCVGFDAQGRILVADSAQHIARLDAGEVEHVRPAAPSASSAHRSWRGLP